MLNKDIKTITYQEKPTFKLAKLIKCTSKSMNELFMNLVTSPSIIVKFKISLFSPFPLFIVIYIYKMPIL